MPTYQYACTECDHAFEQVQSFSDDALTECPQCTGRLRKLFSAVGVVFKGSGFYRTDSRSQERSGTSGDAGSKEPAASSSSGSGSSDSGASGSSGSSGSGDAGASGKSGSSGGGSTSKASKDSSAA